MRIFWKIQLLFSALVFLSMNAVAQEAWELLNPEIPNYNLNSVYFPSENIGYAVGDCGLLLKTVDSGATWTKIFFSVNSDLLTVHFINDSIGVVCSNTSAYKTDDGALTWGKLTLRCPSAYESGCEFYDIWPLSPDSINLAGVCYHYYQELSTYVPYGVVDKVRFSPDVSVCQSWTSSLHYTCIYYSNFYYGYYGDSHGNVWRIIDGQNWTMRQTDLDYVQSIFFADINIGYASGKGGIVKTTDAGTTWSQVYHCSGVTSFCDSYFINKDTGFVVGDAGLILQTQNEGLTWDTIFSGTSERLKSVFFTNDSVGFVVGENLKILKTTDCGNTWLNLEFSEPVIKEKLNAVCLNNNNAGFIVGDSGLVIKSDDFFSTTSTTFIPNYPDLQSVFFTNDSLGYIAGQDGTISLTMDGGDTWTDISTLATMENLYSVFFINDSCGFICGTNGFLSKTVSPNLSWQILNSGTTNNLRSLFFTNASTGYAVGDNGTFLRSQNGGNSWSLISNTAYNYYDLTSISFSDNMNGYLCGNAVIGATKFGSIFKTADGGSTWEEVLAYYSLPELTSILSINESTVYVAGKNGRVIKTVDSFNSIYNYNLSCGNLNSVYFLNSDSGIVVGDDGVILRTTIGHILNIDEPILEKVSEEALVFPNPANYEINFSFNMREIGLCKLRIYDIHGRLVKSEDFYDNAGACILKTNCADFTEGLYFFQILAKYEILSGKFIKE